MSPKTAVRQAATFVLLAYGLAIGIALALPHAGIAPLLSLFVPVTAVTILTFTITPQGHRKKLWGSFGLQRLGVKIWPAAILLPTLFLSFAYVVAVALDVADLGSFDLSGGAIAGAVANTAASLVIFSVLVLGEEIGWRGYLLPRMQSVMSRRRAAVVVGIIHGMFHLPLILLTTTYDSQGNRWIVAPVVVVTIAAAGVFYAWLRDRSGSIWPVAVAHNVANTVFDLGAAAVVTSTPTALAYVAGETGIATMIGVLGMAGWLLSRPNTWNGFAPGFTTAEVASDSELATA